MGLRSGWLVMAVVVEAEGGVQGGASDGGDYPSSLSCGHRYLWKTYLSAWEGMDRLGGGGEADCRLVCIIKRRELVTHFKAAIRVCERSM